MGTETQQEVVQEPVAATLLERMTAAGIGQERARAHISRGVVHVAGEAVTDPDAPVPWPRAWVVGPE